MIATTGVAEGLQKRAFYYDGRSYRGHFCRSPTAPVVDLLRITMYVACDCRFGDLFAVNPPAPTDPGSSWLKCDVTRPFQDSGRWRGLKPAALTLMKARYNHERQRHK